MSNVIRERYEPLKSEEATFAAGSKPSWLSEVTSGTGASVTTESLNGGRAVLDTGTSSTDDNARLVSEPINADQFDAVGVRVVYSLEGNATTPQNAVIALGFRGSGGSGDVMHHHPNHVQSGKMSTVTRDVSGSTFSTDTRVFYDNNIVESELLFDTIDGRAVHRFQGSFAQEINSDLPSQTQDYEAHMLVLTKDTSQTCTLNIYAVELTYYRKQDR